MAQTRAAEGRVEQHHSEWPKETILSEEGLVQISGRYTDPDRAERAFSAVALVWMFLCVAGWFMPISGEEYFMSILFVFPALSCVAGIIFYIFSWRSVDVKIGPEFIVIGGRRYARDGVSGFRGDARPDIVAYRLSRPGCVKGIREKARCRPNCPRGLAPAIA